ncbi:MAG: site-specific integrase [Clostridia bacterium]|nr:site-specific integrase [Clostridia bacterium]
MNYAQWLSEWLEVYEKPSIKPKTYSRYAQIIKHHIVGNLGSYRIHELTPPVLQQYTVSLLQRGNLRRGGGLCPNSVNAILNVIKNSLKTAYAVGKVNKTPCDKIRRPKVHENRVTCFTVAEQKAIEEEILSKSDIRLYGVIVCLYTGLRLGELLALEKSDINFADKTISVTKSCHDGFDEFGKFARITDTPKTANSNRVIPVPRQILPVVEKMYLSSPTPLLISFSLGRAVAVRSYQRSFERLLNRLKIPHKGFHSLRHTFATRALECGMDIKTLAEVLGHKNPTVTLKHYAHSLTEHKNAMMNKVGELFG